MIIQAEPYEQKRENLAKLHAMEADYLPNEATKAIVKNKTFIAVVAPFRSGKTVVSDKVVALEPKIHLINTTTTRFRKEAEDQPNFKTASEGITSSWYLDQVQKGSFANYSVIPGIDVYGTLPEDFPGDFSISPCLPLSLEHLKKAGFKKLLAIYIVTPTDLWREFVNESREALGQDKFKKRALESIASADYALQHIDDFIFLENNIKGEEGITQLAENICDIALNNASEHGLSKQKAIEYLEGIKATAQELALH